MPPKQQGSKLKRQLQSVEETEAKKPRRSDRISSQSNGHDTPLKKGIDAAHLPSPLTHKDSTATEDFKEGTETPPPRDSDESQPGHIFNTYSPPRNVAGLSSPPHDTQPFSQYVVPPHEFNYEVEDEEGEGVWGYLIPLNVNVGDVLVLRQRSACPIPEAKSLNNKRTGRETVSKKKYQKDEEQYEEKKVTGISSGGYLLGRHPECDFRIDAGTVSNRHSLIFPENKGGKGIGVLEDLSSNGTYVNEAIVGRNKRRELEDRDEISISDEARFVFKYPRKRTGHGFRNQYEIGSKLGKGHFASVHLCIERNSGLRYAVKIFGKRPGEQRSKTDGLQQEIAVLMGVSHPALLCLKDTFDEDDGVYLVLELAAEGELFNWIVLKQKLSEAEARKVFIQLFQALKYLHDRNIVHRDIKPENILLTDKNLSVKLADFGLAKIIGEESFTTTLCGTPSYVAPEILENSNYRRYTRAVDVWSLGVVLYICLCGFPPFSEELNSPENPYTLSQQIKQGRFDYPSPYWDPVGDTALDLIDKMLTVDVNKRITIDECLEHPWTTQQEMSLTDSTDGLVGALHQLDFSKRKPQRERTLLSTLNDIHVTKIVELAPEMPPMKIYEKNPAVKKGDKPKTKNGKTNKEAHPAAGRDPNEFIQMGGKGDQQLFKDDQGSIYAPDQTVQATRGKKGKK